MYSRALSVLSYYLFSCIPVVHFYLNNAHEAQVSEMWPLLASAGFTATFVLCLTTALVKLLDKAVLVSALIVFFLFFYGHFFGLFHGLALGEFIIGRQRYILPFWVLTFSFLVAAVIRTKDPFVLANLVKVFKVACLSLVLMNSVRMFQLGFPESQMIRENIHLETSDSAKVSINGWPEPNLPDVYYIILDSYVANHILREEYGFDNQAFVDTLKNLGFYVASDSKSNYAFTSLSLPSSLNMMYLDGIGRLQGDRSKERRILNDLLRDNQVTRCFMKMGYEIKRFGSWWGPTATTDSVHHVSKNWFSLTEFNILFLKTTIFETAAEQFLRPKLREATLATFENLEKVPLSNRPTFAFAHILCPHPPFVFDENGDEISGYVAASAAKIDPRPFYVAQVKFVNRKILQLARSILSTSRSAPIIIIQADHGAGYMMNPVLNSNIMPDQNFLQQQFSILNAYYLPRDGQKHLYDSITPVNSFRLIFNTYFNADFRMLEEKSWYSNQDFPFLMTDVTEELRR